MNREYWLLVTDEPVEFENTNHSRQICGIYLKFNKEKLEDHNMEPVGLGNTRILTDYAQILCRHWWKLNVKISI